MEFPLPDAHLLAPLAGLRAWVPRDGGALTEALGPSPTETGIVNKPQMTHK